MGILFSVGFIFHIDILVIMTNKSIQNLRATRSPTGGCNMEAVANDNPSVPSSCEVAIIGAGPVGLMVANLLGMAGLNVVVLERNHGLVGLPRAIFYDAETLRLFAQIGLFDSIADGLVQDPKVVYLNARGAKLMEITPPRGPFLPWAHDGRAARQRLCAQRSPVAAFPGDGGGERTGRRTRSSNGRLPPGRRCGRGAPKL